MWMARCLIHENSCFTVTSAYSGANGPPGPIELDPRFRGFGPPDKGSARLAVREIKHRASTASVGTPKRRSTGAPSTIRHAQDSRHTEAHTRRGDEPTQGFRGPLRTADDGGPVSDARGGRRAHVAAPRRAY